MGTTALYPVHPPINPEREENGHGHHRGHRHPVVVTPPPVGGALPLPIRCHRRLSGARHPMSGATLTCPVPSQKRESLEQRLYFMWGLINTPMAGLGLVVEHTRALVHVWWCLGAL